MLSDDDFGFGISLQKAVGAGRVGEGPVKRVAHRPGAGLSALEAGHHGKPPVPIGEMEIAQAGMKADRQGARQCGKQEFERIEQQDGGGDGKAPPPQAVMNFALGKTGWWCFSCKGLERGLQVRQSPSGTGKKPGEKSCSLRARRFGTFLSRFF